MIKRRSLRTQNIKVFVLDEADEMLNKGKGILGLFTFQFLLTPGFQEQIYDVYRFLPPTTQVCFTYDYHTAVM